MKATLAKLKCAIIGHDLKNMGMTYDMRGRNKTQPVFLTWVSIQRCKRCELTKITPISNSYHQR